MMYSVGRKDAPSYLETWWWNSDVRKAEDEKRYRLGRGSGRRTWMTGWHTQLRSVQLEGQSDTGCQKERV